MDRTAPSGSFLRYASRASFILAVGLTVWWLTAGHWPPKWHLGLTESTYNNNGVQFTYPRDWKVVERDAKPGTVKFVMNGSRMTRVTQNFAPTLNIEGPHSATVTLALFEPSYRETLKAYADRMKPLLENDWKELGVKSDATEPVVGQIHGTNYNGFRYRFTVHEPGGSESSRVQYFFQLRTRTNNVMFCMQFLEGTVDSPAVKLILDSMKLEGELNMVDTVAYSHVNFEKLEESLNIGHSIAQNLSGEDLAVANAWNNTLADLITARQPLTKAANALDTADILNINTIVRTGDRRADTVQFRNRVLISVAWFGALNDWKNKLQTVPKCYNEQLHKCKVSEGRCAYELDRLAAETASLDRLRAAYDADQQVSSDYNNAVVAMENAVFDGDRREFEKYLSDLNALKNKADQLHQEYQWRVTQQPAGLAGNRIDATSSAPVGKKVGMILYKPERAVAMIGNQTVMAGDGIDGFKIVAIEKDSVTVQSPTGVKLALRMGDVLR